VGIVLRKAKTSQAKQDNESYRTDFKGHVQSFIILHCPSLPDIQDRETALLVEAKIPIFAGESILRATRIVKSPKK
jgi:hypothetical protein